MYFPPVLHKMLVDKIEADLMAENERLRAALTAVDALWTQDANLGFEEEMKAPSPVGLVWNKVKDALKQSRPPWQRQQ